MPVNLQGHRQFVGNRQPDHLLVVLNRLIERLGDRLAQPLELLAIEIGAALVWREARLPEDLIYP